MFKVSRGTISPIKPKGTARTICKIKRHKIIKTPQKEKIPYFAPVSPYFLKIHKRFRVINQKKTTKPLNFTVSEEKFATIHMFHVKQIPYGRAVCVWCMRIRVKNTKKAQKIELKRLETG